MAKPVGVVSSKVIINTYLFWFYFQAEQTLMTVIFHRLESVCDKSSLRGAREVEIWVN